MYAVFGWVVWLQNRVIFLLLVIPILLGILGAGEKILHRHLHSSTL